MAVLNKKEQEMRKNDGKTLPPIARGGEPPQRWRGWSPRQRGESRNPSVTRTLRRSPVLFWVLARHLPFTCNECERSTCDEYERSSYTVHANQTHAVHANKIMGGKGFSPFVSSLSCFYLAHFALKLLALTPTLQI